MSTLTHPTTLDTAELRPCPWWCTDDTSAHAWQLDREGRPTRFHRRRVGGFTMSAVESVSPTGESTIRMNPTHADVVLLDTAAEAAELSENLHQVAAILRQIESGLGQ